MPVRMASYTPVMHDKNVRCGDAPGRVAVLHQGFVPSYRRAFFERLSQAGPIEYVVFYGDPPAGSGLRGERGPFEFPSVYVRNVVLPFMGRSVVWQPVLRHVLGQGFDAVVIGHEIRFLANNLIFLWFKALRRPVLYWGHGTEIERDVRGLARIPRALAVAAKRVAARRADGYLVYTEGGRLHLIRDGVKADRVTVVRNTIDTTEERCLAVECRQFPERDIREELGLRPDSAVFVFLGRLYSEKRMDELPSAIALALDRKWISRPVEIAVIGSGPDTASLRARWEGTAWVRFTGGLPAHEVAKYLRVAAAVVIPGKVGLAVNHAFAHGRPVITRRTALHSPEVEYIEHGRNGLVVDGDEQAFAQVLARFIDDDALQTRLAEGAGRTSETLQLQHMVTAFDSAVRRSLVTTRTPNCPARDQ